MKAEDVPPFAAVEDHELQVLRELAKGRSVIVAAVSAAPAVTTEAKSVAPLASVSPLTVTASGVTLNTSIAVRAWISSPRRKASISASSPERWARILSSIWE